VISKESTLSKAEIHAGICGFNTVVVARSDGEVVHLIITSNCQAIQRLSQVLTEVEPYHEISARRSIPQTLEKGMKFCTHAACPVLVGIIKAKEVEAGLALPADVSIRISKSNEA
jgi:hypothetical protein